MLITANSVIDTPYEIILVVAAAFVVALVLMKLGLFLESLPAPGGSSKSKKEVVKEVKKEIKKEETATVNENKDKDKKAEQTNNSGCGNSYTCPYANMQAPTVTGGGGCNNYLYERFVDSPTAIDVVEPKKVSESFISNEEFSKIKDRDVKIRVKEDNSSVTKNALYNRINQMTSQNNEKREKLLEEFEGLSREMKLLIIENIIQKM